jgi:hypothetical protein
MRQILVQLGTWVSPYLSEIAIGVAATLLTIFGNDINLYVRRTFKKNHFMVRFCVFVALCSVGYTFLTNFFVSFLSNFLHLFSMEHLALGVMGVFALMAWIASIKGHV